MASVPYTCLPIAPQPFRVLLLRRLWLSFLPNARNGRCGLPLDSCGHHRAACAAAGVLRRRGFAVESAAARVCREGGTRVSVDVRQDMDLARPDALIAVLRSWRTASPSSREPSWQWTPRSYPPSDVTGILTVDAACRRKERIYPELTVSSVAPFHWSSLVKLRGVVRGMPRFPQSVGESKSEARTPPFTGQSTPSLAAQVGDALGLQCCKSFGPLALGTQRRVGSGWYHSANHSGDQ